MEVTIMTREKFLKGMMTTVTVFTIFCWMLLIAFLIMAICGNPIPVVDTIVLFVLEVFISISIYKYYTEYRYDL